MDSRRARSAVLGAVTALVLLGVAAPVVASPAPVSGCPPCGRGFVQGAANHGLDTEVRHGEAMVRVYRNGSATWTVRVVPTDESVLEALATNRSLARAVTTDSFGTRYGGGFDHELVGSMVADGAFVMRYRTLGVVGEGPFGTRVLTYFRDAPGAWVYTELGADELTVVAPPGMTVARGFGDVAGDRMTATELPGVRDGPFVVFAPEGSAAPGLLGFLAVADALWRVVVRNVLYFVALPGGVIVGGFAAVRRLLDPKRNWDPTRLGGLVAAGGAVLFVGTVGSEVGPRLAVTGNLLVGGVVGVLLLALGASVAVPAVRRHLTGPRLVWAGIAVAVVATVVVDGLLWTSGFHRSLSLAAALLPAAVALGWVDATESAEASSLARRLVVGLSVAIVAVLAATAPLTALGGTLFLLAPILLTVAALAVVVVAVPLYLLGAAGSNAERS